MFNLLTKIVILRTVFKPHYSSKALTKNEPMDTSELPSKCLSGYQTSSSSQLHILASINHR
jgi:hypothetical protein